MSFSLAPSFPISSFNTSTNLLFHLPLFLFPGNSNSIILLPTYSWSLLMTSPYHLSLSFLIFIPNRSTLTVPLILIFNLSFFFFHHSHNNLNIFISATSISSTCLFVTATVSSPYTIVGLTTELYTFPITLAGKITPDTFLHPFHPACSLLFTSISQLQLSSTVDPKYLNSFTLGTFCFPFSLFLCHFLHLRTDIWYLTYLLSFLFFPTHTSSILVPFHFFPGLFANYNIIRKQHRPRLFSPYFVH